LKPTATDRYALSLWSTIDGTAWYSIAAISMSIGTMFAGFTTRRMSSGAISGNRTHNSTAHRHTDTSAIVCIQLTITYRVAIRRIGTRNHRIVGESWAHQTWCEWCLALHYPTSPPAQAHQRLQLTMQSLLIPLAEAHSLKDVKLSCIQLVVGYNFNHGSFGHIGKCEVGCVFRRRKARREIGTHEIQCRLRTTSNSSRNAGEGKACTAPPQTCLVVSSLLATAASSKRNALLESIFVW
jgi:hypothetical protein